MGFTNIFAKMITGKIKKNKLRVPSKNKNETPKKKYKNTPTNKSK
jgi:hypothetical protein